MAKSSIFLLALAILTGGMTEPSAQVMDMRAFSRQRGFKAYQAKSVTRPQRQQIGAENIRSQQSQTPVADGTVLQKQDLSKTEQKTDQTDEIQQYIANNPQVKPDI